MVISIYLDDIRPAPSGFVRTYTAAETVDLLKQCQKDGTQVHILSLDNDLGEGQPEGYTVLDWIEEQVFTDKSFVLPDVILVHSANPSAKARMEMVIERLYP